MADETQKGLTPEELAQHSEADLKKTYLEGLAKWGTIGKARNACGISLDKVRELRQDPVFREMEDLHMEEFKGTLIDAAVEQGRDGILEDVIYMGKRQYEMIPGTKEYKLVENQPVPLRVRKYTPTLLVKVIDHFFPNKGEDEDNKPARLNLNVVRIKDGDRYAQQ